MTHLLTKNKNIRWILHIRWILLCKVLESGPNDLVFINFADHGGGKIVEFPNGPYLHAEV
jgi:hypothetical protein